MPASAGLAVTSHGPTGAGDPADARDRSERRREPGPAAGWSDRWVLDFWADDAALGGTVGLVLLPNQNRSVYWAALVGDERSLVTVIEQEAPLPRAPGMEMRYSGLWTDLIVETPFEHMTVGLEAFGLAFDDPGELYRRGWGDRTPLGFDLEWETAGSLEWAQLDTRYDLPCRVHGEVLVGHDVIDFDGWGHRSHAWGADDLWTSPWSMLTGRLAAGSIDDEAVRVDSGGVASAVSSDLDAIGLPMSARARVGDLYVAAEPIAWAPVPIAGSPGVATRLPRTLVRLTAGDGRVGAGWLELNQPQ